MNIFEDLEKKAKMVFPKEESPEKIIEKEQNAINDFIANLDKDIFKDLSNFPLKLPMELDYPDSIELDDFILLSIKDDFYIFPKMFEDKIYEYLEYKKYLSKTRRPNSFIKKWLISLTEEKRYEICRNFSDYSYTGYWIAIIFLLLGLYVAGKSNSFLTVFICVVGLPSLVIVLGFYLYWRMLRLEDEVKYINYEEGFTELLSGLKALNLPLEFFDKHFKEIKVI